MSAVAITVVGTLDVGILVAGVLHRDFEMRQATLADSYRAAEAVPVPADVADNQAARVAYQMAVDDAAILSQVVRLGGLDPVPGPAALAAEIDPDDMARLRQAADDVKKKWRESRIGLPTFGAPSLSSSAPG